MIALLCSVPAEAELLMGKLSAGKRSVVGSKLVADGTIGNRNVVVCIGGMGKVNAAHAATLLLRYEPEVLIIFGIGGAYPSAGARPGDIAVATVEIAGDEGVETGDGFKDTSFIGIPLVKTGSFELFNSFPAPAGMAEHCLKKLTMNGQRRKVHQGTFVTLSTCTGTTRRSRELESRYRALCENMEGAAAAQVALSHGVPWLEVRGISNLVQDRDLRQWDIPGAAKAVQHAVLDLIEAWG